MGPWRDDSTRKLGRLRRGVRVHVEVSGGDANVRLVDRANRRLLRSGREATRFYGGRVKQGTETVIQVPKEGVWFLALESLAPPPARVSLKTWCEPPPLPERSLQGLRNTPPKAGSPDDDGYHDVFLCYASEDRAAVAEPLARELRNLGVEVWFDRFTLGLGDSLTRKVNEGLAGSRFGIVVLSKAFFEKEWPNRELEAMINLSVYCEQKILPVWHEITKEDVLSRMPLMGDRISRDTRQFSVTEIASEIALFVHS
ncbi:DUF1883 domain-containing protein [Lentzea sp. HUAS TT2]|uniref:DUF1883 domain-containing protein n=1 Tax=Lentzea sp. HUAS TT2 TaxID=3447454 RepID=UPI003F6F339E